MCRISTVAWRVGLGNKEKTMIKGSLWTWRLTTDALSYICMTAMDTQFHDCWGYGRSTSRGLVKPHFCLKFTLKSREMVSLTFQISKFSRGTWTPPPPPSFVTPNCHSYLNPPSPNGSCVPGFTIIVIFRTCKSEINTRVVLARVYLT